MRRFTRTLEHRLDVVSRANAARRANQLGADLFSRSHSLLVAFLEAGLSTDFGTTGLGSAPVFDSAGFASGLAAVSPLAPVSPLLSVGAAAGAVCGFLPSLP